MKYPFRKILLIIFFFTAQMGYLSWAIADRQQESSNINEQELSQEESQLQKKDLFQYQREGEPDPFKPFIHQPSIPVPSRPLQNFTLVGVIVVGKEKVAMVEDASGKGYYLNKGSRIGRGIVSKIEDKEVRLIETVKKTTGRIVTKELIMYLKKEGDK